MKLIQLVFFVCTLTNTFSQYSNVAFFPLDVDDSGLKTNNVIDIYGENITSYDRFTHKVFTFSLNGELLNEYDFSDISNDSDDITSYCYDIDHKVHLVVNHLTNELYSYSEDGIKLHSQSVPFNITTFYVSQSGHYVFYSPMAVYDNRETIIITDRQFNILSEDFKGDKTVESFNELSSGRLKLFNNEIYFNPPKTNSIFKLEEEKWVEVFSGGNYKSINGRANPILKYFIVGDRILISYFNHEKELYYDLIDVDSGKVALSHMAKAQLTNISEFNYSYTIPQIAIGDSLFKFGKCDQFNSFIEYVRKENEKVKMPESFQDADCNLYLFNFEY